MTTYNVVTDWVDLGLEGIRKFNQLKDDKLSRGGPPQASRSIGIIVSCIYNAWTAFDSKATPLVGNVCKHTAPFHEADIKKAISAAAEVAIRNQFNPENYSSSFADFFNILINNKLLAYGVDLNSPDNYVAEAINAAKAVLSSRENDGSNQAGDYKETSTPPYAPSNPPMAVFRPADAKSIANPDKWQSLTFVNANISKIVQPNFIAPHWGEVVPFALTGGSALRPPVGPALWTEQKFYDQARQVLDVQAHLTPKQMLIAEYWANGPTTSLPPGQWMEISAEVAQQKTMNIAATVKLFFAVGNAVMDAGIACWDTKRFFDSARPVTAIRYLFRGQLIRGWGGPGIGIVDLYGDYWQPFQVPWFPTPPFAEFTSGHSTFSSAAARVLALFTKSDDYGGSHAQARPLDADPTVDVLGLTLSWPTFSEAAAEAGASRLFGGIHFQEGNVVGLSMGRQIGEQVFAKAKVLWNED
jgi:hypothetical protein